MAKLTPLPIHVAPRGYGYPTQVLTIGVIGKREPFLFTIPSRCATAGMSLALRLRPFARILVVVVRWIVLAALIIACAAPAAIWYRYPPARSSFAAPGPLDRILVEKAQRRLTTF